MIVRSLAALLLALTVLSPDRARAGIVPAIAWGSPQTISGDGNVLTSGSLVYAFNFGYSGLGGVTTTTVNGVVFAPFGVGSPVATKTVDDLTLAEYPALLWGYDSFGYAASPYSGLTTSYKALLDQAIYASEPGTITVTLGGLTAGQTYSVQWWTNDSSLSYGSRTTASGVTAVTLDSNTTNAYGGVGEYAIGTFTAASATQSFTLSGSADSGVFDFPIISGLQLRTGAVTPVPEIDPAGTRGAFALVAAALGLLRHRRTKVG